MVLDLSIRTKSINDCDHGKKQRMEGIGEDKVIIEFTICKP